MNFQSISDLQRSLQNGAWKLPPDLDVIVGVPRSGLLAANLLALHLNLPLTDVDGLIAGRLLGCGRRMRQPLPDLRSTQCHALILDDSVASGRSMQRVRERLATGRVAARLTFATVYGPTDVSAATAVDVVLDRCPHPRVFEWNLMHGAQIGHSCVDIDGVLCRDPTQQENDDGPRYARFLAEAEPLLLPSQPIGCLVTCRLEKYRAQTQAWLDRHDVEYDELIMLDLPTAADRRAAGCHGRFKGEVYRARPHNLFVESSLRQAIEIADVANKPVLCVENRRMVYPRVTAMLRSGGDRINQALQRRARFARSTIGLRLQRFGRGWWQHTSDSRRYDPPSIIGKAR